MKFKKFIHIKDFFYPIFSKKEYEVDVFINSYSLNAVIDYINNGYVLTKNQDEKLKEILSANILYESDIEKFINKNLPDKYKYFILTEKCIKIFKQSGKDIPNIPHTVQWLLKKTDSEIAKNLMINWKETFISVVKSNNSQEIDKKLREIKEFEHYLILLSEPEKQNLVDFINQQAKKSKGFFNHQHNIKEDLEHLASYLENLQIKKNSTNSNLNEIINILKEHGEVEIITKLETIDEQYRALFVEFKDMDKNKRNALMDLYEKYLLNGLKQYIAIKPAIRKKTINNKNAQGMILENIEEIKTIFDVELKIINEQKLMTLSSKSEYLSQLKKQW